MRRDGEATRQKLLDAATRMFADRGIAGVSLTEINKAAGQRNSSALQYHFRSRDGLLKALLARHTPALAEHRRELLEHAAASPTVVRAAAEAFVLPLAELLTTDWRGRAFLRIVTDLRTDPRRTYGEIDELVGYTASVEVTELIVAAFEGLPQPLIRERVLVAGTMVLHALADRSRLIDTARRGQRVVDARLFVANLVDMYVGAVLTPASAATLALAGFPTTGENGRNAV
jgi:AcrR family transcriptional regulator